MNLHFLVIENEPNDFIVGEPLMEILNGVLDIGNRLAPFTIEGETFQISMESDYFYEDLEAKNGTDSNYFTSAFSAVVSPEHSDEKMGIW